MNPHELALPAEATTAERQIASAGEVIVMVVSEEAEAPRPTEVETESAEIIGEALSFEPITTQPDLIAYLENQALEQATANLAALNPNPIVIVRPQRTAGPRLTHPATGSRAEQLELEIQAL
jgi:hypothetical protein